MKWDGLRWVSLEGGVGPTGSIVQALASDGAGVYVGGFFGTVGNGLVSSHLARWTETADSVFSDGLEGL